jgi:alkylation response protein AidB-like acyl-CoA dehydrogenase
MNTILTEEQKQIRQTTEELLESKGGVELARKQMRSGEVVDDLWDELTKLDYPAIMIPQEYGGLGEGMSYAITALESMGYYAMPGPFPETAVMCVSLLCNLGSPEQKRSYLRPVVSGDSRFSFAISDQNESIPRAIQMEGRVQPTGEITLSGKKRVVTHAEDVDRIFVASRTGAGTGLDGISICIVDPSDTSVSLTQRQALDRTRPLYTMQIDDLTVKSENVLGPPHQAGDALRQAIDRFTVAICAMLVGGGRAAVERSTTHSQNREQYGHPIGRFQAVKHRIVNMFVDVRAAQSLTYHAALAIENQTEDAPQTVAACKAYTADRLHRVFGDDIWNHGGLGFTWDHDSHIFLKQAKSWRNFLGSPESSRERLFSTL